MNVVFTVAAQRDVEEIDAWWRQHRPDAEDAFRAELSAAIEAVSITPAIGRVYRRRPAVRRWMLPTSRHHLYYALGEDVVVIMRVWSALRRRPPLQ
jgi:plasmid stabilization system protein ParE